MKRNIVQYIDSKEYGGAEELLYNLLEVMDLNMWRPFLFHHPSEGIGKLVKKVKKLDIETVCLPKINGLHDIKNIRIFIREIKRIDPQVFHAHLPWHLRCTYGMLCAYLSSVPAILATQHAFVKIRGLKLSIIQKLISLIVDRYIAVSDGIGDKLRESIFFEERLEVIHNGININRFSVNESSAFMMSLRDKGMPIVLNVARLDNNKGHIDLINAASKTPNAIFLLVGDGPEKTSFEQQAKELDLEDRVMFLGQRDDIPELLCGCDLFILPSLFEGGPLTILEAMAAGKPVVATDIPGIDEEVVHNVTGLLVPPENPDELAQALDSLVSKPEFAKELGRAGRKRAEKEFSSKKMAVSVTDLYKELLNIA